GGDFTLEELVALVAPLQVAVGGESGGPLRGGERNGGLLAQGELLFAHANTGFAVEQLDFGLAGCVRAHAQGNGRVGRQQLAAGQLEDEIAAIAAAKGDKQLAMYEGNSRGANAVVAQA